MSVQNIPPPPEGLCGYLGCVFKPHNDDQHTWTTPAKSRRKNITYSDTPPKKKGTQ